MYNTTYHDGERRDQVAPLPARPRSQYQPSSPSLPRSAPTSPLSRRAEPSRSPADTLTDPSAADFSIDQYIRRSTTYPMQAAPDASMSRCGYRCPVQSHMRESLQDDGPRPFMEAPLPSLAALRQASSKLYQPLNPWQTRIIELQPDRYENPLSCELHTVEFTDMDGVGISRTSKVIKYEALSYSWGTGKIESTIICNGVVWAIGENLGTALRYMRDERSSRYIWCDAICINQSDDTEKAQQVRNMLRVFEKADQVIAWIGAPQYPQDDGGFREGGYLGRTLNETNVLFSALNNDSLVDCLLSDNFSSQGQHRPDCGATANKIYATFMEHCERTWFSRTWVRQEVFAAKRIIIQCGFASIDFDRFSALIFQFVNAWARLGFSVLNPGDHRPSVDLPDLVPPETCNTLRHDFLHAGTDRRSYKAPYVRRRYTYHWLRVLQKGTSFDVTDPRDRVYGLLGLINSHSTKWYVESPLATQDAEFPIDYSKSVAQVYQDVVKYLINTEENLDVLQTFESRKNRDFGVRSWTIDWRQASHVGSPGNVLVLPSERSFLKLPPNSAAERSRYRIPIKQNMTTEGLELMGIRVGHPLSSLDARESVTRDALKSAWPPLHHMDGSYEKVLCSGAFIHSQPQTPRNQRPDLWLQFKSNRRLLLENLDRLSPLLVPRTTRIDDIIVALKGAQVFHLLRPSRNNTFLFLGPVVIEGWYGRMKSSSSRTADTEHETEGDLNASPMPLWEQYEEKSLERFLIV